MQVLSDVWLVLRRAALEARADRVTTTAQAVAYSLFLAIPATLLLVLGVFSLVADAAAGRRPDRSCRDRHAAGGRHAPARQPRADERVLGLRILLTLLGALLALWTTTSAASTLMEGLTTAYDEVDERSFLRKRLLALAIVACLLTAALLVMGLLVLGPQVERRFGDAVDAERLTAWVWWTAQWPVFFVALLLAFAVLLALGPDADEVPWRLVSPGAVTALVVWLAASAGFAVFTARFGSYEKTWGTLSAVVIMLVWLWLTSAALLFGAEVNAEAARRARQPDEAVSSCGAPTGFDSGEPR
jgi:membrane protein